MFSRHQLAFTGIGGCLACIAHLSLDSRQRSRLKAQSSDLLDLSQIQVPLQFCEDTGEVNPGLQPANDRQKHENSGKQI